MNTISELFRAQAARTPDAAALVFNGERATYAGLGARAEAVARVLRTRGIGAEDFVALAMRNSPELVAALLGVASVGAAYVGVDLRWPLPRVHAVLHDSKPCLLLADDNDVARSARFDGEILILPRDAPAAAGEAARGAPGAAHADSLLSAVYTSGTTGRPKGVLVTAGSVMNRLEWMWNTHPFEAGDVAFLHRSYTTVGFSWDCFGPLLRGVPVVISPVEDARDVIGTVTVAAGAEVTHVSASVAFWDAVLDLAERQPKLWPSLRLARTSGEPLRPALVERWRRAFPRARLLNIYGATECSGSTAYDTSPLDPAAAARVPVGTPVPGVEVLVVDETMSLVGPGREGEICIGGRSLARGYLSDPVLTAERFVPRPGGPAGGRVFRTGDLGVWRADGQLDTTGRRDLQVKVRGHRVEVEEVEAALARCPGVREAAVHGRRDGGNTLLVAVVVPEGRVTTGDLRDALALMLPDYMIPVEFAAVSELPRTAGGKIDRRALGGLEGAELDRTTAYTAPRTPSEATVCAVWADVLGMSDIGAEENFFELGGHSLTGIRIVARLQDLFGIELPLRALFDNPSVRELAAAIDRRVERGAGTEVSGATTMRWV